MPQLMPLNWIFSNMMILVVLVNMAMIYSEKEKMNKIMGNISSPSNMMNIWCW